MRRLLPLLLLLVACSAPVASPPVQNDVQRYLNTVSPHVSGIGSALRTLSGQMDKAAARPCCAMFIDPEWRVTTSTALGLLRGHGNALRLQTSVPPEAATLSAELVDLGDDTVYIADEWQAGIDLIDMQRITNGTVRAAAMSEKTRRATAEVARITGH